MDTPTVPAPAEPRPTPPEEPRPQYEFSAGENKVFGELADNLSFTGWFLIILVVAFHAVLLGRWAYRGVPMFEKFRLLYVVWPVLVLACSVSFIGAARAFRKVVDTQGSDINHLMSGLTSLNSAFDVLNFMPRIWLLVAIIAGIVGGAILAWSYIMGY